MKILAIDPGNVESAFVIYDTTDSSLKMFGKKPNDVVMVLIDGILTQKLADAMIVEQVACMGMAVGESVFETVFWSGRFVERWGRTWDRVKRHQVKMHLCNSMRAKDGNIRQALIDRFGEPGTKKAQGKTYGISGDVWAALAVAVTWSDQHEVNNA